MSRRAARWAFPAVVIAFFLALVALDLNGSSVALLAPKGTATSGLLAGTPRLIRTDEYVITTPLAVSTTREGFRHDPWVGLVRTEQLVLADGAPTHELLEIVKPQDWGYLVLGASYGLAWHWWFPLLAGLLGLFLLLRMLGLNATTAAGLAIGGTLTPYMAWWSGPSPGAFMGFGCLLAVLLMRGVTGSRARSAFVWGLGAGVTAAAFALLLYPPWQVSLAIVLAGVVLGYAWDVRCDARRLVATAGGAVLTGAPLIGAWYVSNHAAITATAGTIYPGNRRSTGGTAVLSWVLDAPLAPLFAGHLGQTLRASPAQPFANLSETSSSWLPLPVLLVAAVAGLAAVRRLRRAPAPATTTQATTAQATTAQADDGGAARHPGVGTLIGLLLAVLVLLAWAFLPIPPSVGTVVFNRVKPSRLPLALGLAGVLLVAIAGSLADRARRRARSGSRAVPWALGWVVAVAATVLLTVWSARELPWDTSALPWVEVLGCGALVAVVFAALASGVGRRVAAVALAVFALWSFALVNPLMRGLGPLADDPLVVALRPLAQADPGARVEVFGPTTTVALVRASGLESLSGITFYPNGSLMRRLDPGQEPLWNNYTNYTWVADPHAHPIRIRRVNGTSMTLLVAPCAAPVLALGATFAVSTAPLPQKCLSLVRTVADGPATAYIYRVQR